MKVNYKIVGFVIVIFIIIVVASFTFFGSKKNEVEHIEKEKINKTLCKSIIFPKLNEICNAAFDKNLSVCNRFKGEYKKYCAKAVLSRIKVNHTTCDKINDSVIKNICLRKLAKEENNLSLCQDNACYFYFSTPESCNLIDVDYLKYFCLAKSTKSIKYCDKIKDNWDAMSCKSLFSKNISTCKIQNTYNDYCIIRVSINSGNWEYCLNISTKYARAKCVALASDNIKNCNKLGIEKDLCKVWFLGRDLELTIPWI